MSGRIKLHPAAAIFSILTLAVALAVPLAARDTKKAQQPDTSKYVGSETCKACHEEVFKKFEATPHWKTMLDTKGGPAKQGCESCHGPGGDHVEGGGDKTKISLFKSMKSRQVSEKCMTCHEFTEEHSNFARSQHATNNVSCTDCHSAHSAKNPQFLLTAKTQKDLCYSCHGEMRSQFAKPFRHRVNENLIKCTDCHNQHGGFLTKMARATAAQDQMCFKCHTDKAGPFTFEHVPVKTEGCISCHVPHGSSNQRMLKRSQVNLLCLECHTITSDPSILAPPPAGPAHNQAQKYQACTICHLQIHGSNHSAVFFR
jgi:DmsE family decaheme c-type cytochrome